MSGYTVPPPSYQGSTTNKSTYGTASAEPLLQGQASGTHQYNDDDGDQIPDDLDDDFKIGVTAAQSSPEIRNAFIRKVYGILFIQLLGTRATPLHQTQPTSPARITPFGLVKLARFVSRRADCAVVLQVRLLLERL